MKSTVELKHLELHPSLGTYGPGDVVPDVHLLDLSLTIDPKLVLIAVDGMEHIFDYDPLIVEIDRLAKDGHYVTQERLMTRIAHACAAYGEIQAVDMTLSKRPVLNGSGELGVSLSVDAGAMEALRSGKSPFSA
ncbi:MAG: dihydroneopterin aldolase [Pseudomonadota bacterium]